MHQTLRRLCLASAEGHVSVTSQFGPMKDCPEHLTPWGRLTWAGRDRLEIRLVLLGGEQ